MILALESGAEFSSVSMGCVKSYSTIRLSTKRNTESLLEAVNHLRSIRAKEQITKVGVCIGPGSYTGLRVGLALAQGLSLGFGAELVCVSSFLAQVYSERELEGEKVAEVFLRTGEIAIARFLLEEGGARVTQVGGSEIVYESRGPREINSNGVLLAASLIASNNFSTSGEEHLIRTSGTEPVQLMYLKGVQAKTLAERGCSNVL